MPSETPKISVIIPTYNRSDLLKNAIASVQGQTLEDWELIVVDDGSMDDTKAVVHDLIKKDPRIKYFYQENAGQASARNTGIKIARGIYIAFLDSDDVYLPKNLEKKVHVLEARKDALIVNGASWIVEHRTGKFIDCAAYAPTNWLVRREFLVAGKMFDPKQRSVEDMGIRIRAANASDNPSIEYMLPEPLTIYFLNDSQVSHSPNKNPDVFAKRTETLLGDLDVAKKRSYATFAPYIFSRLANFYALQGDFAKAKIFFRKSLSIKFTVFSLKLLVATYGGSGFYQFTEQFLRSIQHGILWKTRLVIAKRKYRESFLTAIRSLRAQSVS